MKINWKVRIKNPVFWAQVAADHLGGLWGNLCEGNFQSGSDCVGFGVGVESHHRPDNQRSWGQQTGIELPEAKRGVIHGDYQEHWRDCGHGAFLLDTHYLALQASAEKDFRLDSAGQPGRGVLGCH